MAKKTETKRLLVGADVKAQKSGGVYRTLVGFAAAYNNVDRGGDVITQGAFAKSIKESVPKGSVPLLDGHEHSSARSTIGTIVKATEQPHGLMIEAELATTDRAQEIAQLVAEGHVKSMSIGYQVVPGKVRVGEIEGKTVTYLDEIKLLETSVVSVPMNPEATIVGVKGMESEATTTSFYVDLRHISALSDPAAKLAAYDALAKSIPEAAPETVSTSTEAVDTKSADTSETVTAEADDVDEFVHSFLDGVRAQFKSEPTTSLGSEPTDSLADGSQVTEDALMSLSATEAVETTADSFNDLLRRFDV